MCLLHLQDGNSLVLLLFTQFSSLLRIKQDAGSVDGWKNKWRLNRDSDVKVQTIYHKYPTTPAAAAAPYSSAHLILHTWKCVLSAKHSQNCLKSVRTAIY